MSSNYFIYEVVVFALLDKPVVIDRLTKEQVYGNIKPDDFNFHTFLERRRTIMAEKVKNIAIYGPDINYIIFYTRALPDDYYEIEAGLLTDPAQAYGQFTIRS